MLRKSNFNHSLRVQGILDSKGVLNKARLDEVKAEIQQRISFTSVDLPCSANSLRVIHGMENSFDQEIQ